MEEHPFLHESVHNLNLIGSQVLIGFVSLVDSDHLFIHQGHFTQHSDEDRSKKIDNGGGQEEVVPDMVELVEGFEDHSEAENGDELSVVAKRVVPIPQSGSRSGCRLMDLGLDEDAVEGHGQVDQCDG